MPPPYLIISRVWHFYLNFFGYISQLFMSICITFMFVQFFEKRCSYAHFEPFLFNYHYKPTRRSGVFSTGATGALAPVILGQYYCHLPFAPAILGQSITVSTRNSKVLNTPLKFIWFLRPKFLKNSYAFG